MTKKASSALSKKTGFGGFDRIELVVHRRGRTGQVPNTIYLQLDRLSNVVPDQLKAGMTDPMSDVGLAPGEVVVEADHLLPGLHQPVDQMGTKKAGTPSDKVDLHA